MRLEAIVICVAMVGVLLSSGCVVLTRVTVAPTVDMLGGVGADFRVSVAPAVPGGWAGGFGADVEVGGSYLGTERVGAAQVRIGPEFSKPAGPTLVRIGLGYSGRYTGPMLPGACADPAVTSSAVLNGGLAYVGLDAPLSAEPSGMLKSGLEYVSLGPELTVELLTGSGACEVPSRGLFSLGLSLSVVYRIM